MWRYEWRKILISTRFTQWQVQGWAGPRLFNRSRSRSPGSLAAWSQPARRGVALFDKVVDKLLWRGFPRKPCHSEVQTTLIKPPTSSHSLQTLDQKQECPWTPPIVREPLKANPDARLPRESGYGTQWGRISQRQSSQPPSFVSFARDKVAGNRSKMAANVTLCGASSMLRRCCLVCKCGKLIVCAVRLYCMPSP